MEGQENKSKKKCFIITPIGADKSDIRRSADGVINSVIRPLLEQTFNFNDVKAAHEINASGSINNQIMSRIIEDDLVIANLSGINPNVMYEVAVRHATMKPIVHICEDGTKLPFDIIDQRTLFYKNDMLGVQELKQNLMSLIEAVLKSDKCNDNPIYNAAKNKIYEETIINDPEKSFEKYLLERFNKLESKLIGKKPNIDKESNYKYTETFDIQLTVDTNFDKENFYLEMERGLEKENLGLSFFKIMKSENMDTKIVVSILQSVGCNKWFPTKGEVESIISQMKYNTISNYKVEGNELPF